MLRKTLTILSLIGLLLSVGLWGVSGFYHVNFIPKSLNFTVRMAGGNVSLTLPDEPFVKAPDDVLRHGRKASPGALTYVEIGDSQNYTIYAVDGVYFAEIPRLIRGKWFGLPYVKRNVVGMGPPALYIGIPLWLVFLFSLAVFSLCHPIRTHRRRKRKKLGLCLKCGYDLRASKDICPECGEEFGSTNP